MEIKKAMIGHAKYSYILADSSKFGHTYLSHICSLNEVSAVLTDKDLNVVYKEAAQKKGYPIIWEWKER